MKKSVCIILLLLACSCGKFADSDKELIDSMSSHAHELYDKKNYNAAIDTMNKVALIAARRDNPEELANCYNRLGMLYWAIKDTGSSMNYYRRALEFAKVVSKDLQAKILTNMGHGFRDIGDNTNAYYYYSQIDFLNLAPDNPNYNFNLLNLGYIFNEYHQFNKARDNAKKALKYFKPKRENQYIIACYQIIMICDAAEKKPFEINYSKIKDDYVAYNLCTIYLEQNEFKKCDSVAEQLNHIKADHILLGDGYYLQGLSSYKQKEYRKSLEYLRHSDEIVDNMDYNRQKKILDLKIQNYTSLRDMHNLNIAQQELHEVEEKIAELEERNQHELLSMQRIARAQHNILEYELNILKNDTALSRIYTFVAIVWIVFSAAVLYIVFFRGRNRNIWEILKRINESIKKKFF